MSYRVVITPDAKIDIRASLKYISEELKNKKAAGDMSLLIRREISSLSEMPSRAALANDEYLASQKIRYLFVKNYILFFVVYEEEKTVSIIRFLYAGRNWQNLLK